MSRRSTATVRATPLSGATSGSGSLTVQTDTFTVETVERVHILDLTERVAGIVSRMPVREGIVHVFSLHTTCALFINEYQSALVRDIRTLLERLVEREGPWTHNDPAHSDCDRFNADAHLRTLLLGQSVMLQVSGGEIVLGQWQRVLMAELDGPRARTFRVMVMGAG
jgi:secondary thiamine-phosphate synthase enzyme